MGDLAFPAFSLAKILRKAPQMIAADVAEKMDATGFEKIEAVGPYINFFLDKKSISADILGQVIANGSDYASQLDTFVQPLSVIAWLIFLKNSAIKLLKSITSVTGVNNSVC